MKNKQQRINIILGIIFLAYLLLMFKILFFKYIPLMDILDSDREVIRSINLIPFSTIHNYYSDFSNHFIALFNVLGNIIIFIPLGVYLKVFKKDIKFKNCVTITFLTSLCVEIIQFTFGIGIADIDDIILNTIGGVVGLFVYNFIYMILKDEEKVKISIIVCVFFVSLMYIALMLYANYKGIRIKIL